MWQLRVAFWALQRARAAWARLTHDDREQLRSLLLKSRGRGSRLSERERHQLRALLRKAGGRRPRAV